MRVVHVWSTAGSGTCTNLALLTVLEAHFLQALARMDFDARYVKEGLSARSSEAYRACGRAP